MKSLVRGMGMKSPSYPMREAPISKNRSGTEACRRQWRKQAGSSPPYIPLDSHTPSETPERYKYGKECKFLS